MLTGKSFRLVGWHSAQVLQITLVTNQHNDDVRIGMVPQFLQPSRYIDIGCVFGDIVNQKGTDGTPVVSRSIIKNTENLKQRECISYAEVMAR